MTRYTFVLLVCRAIGVLSAAYLIWHIVVAFDEVNWALDPRWTDKPPWASFPFIEIAFALAIPLVGLIAGLQAERIAAKLCRAASRAAAVPALTGFAIAVVIGAYLCIASAGNAQLDAIHGWRYSTESAALAAMRARVRYGERPTDGHRDLALSAGFAICLGGTFAAALRATSGASTA